MKKRTPYRVLFAGGGTGGHLFPALAVADKLRSLKPETEILFVGTKDKIESRSVPKAGYSFKTIWISGFQRKLSFSTLLFPLKLFIAVFQGIVISMKFKPSVAVGSGGYVAGPAIFGAKVMGARIILLEQNSYPGVTTRLLERFANELHLMFENSQKFLRRKEIHKLTGNPVRAEMKRISKEEARKKMGLQPDRPVLLILGGSLGARSINDAVVEAREQLLKEDIQLIWQTGKGYYEDYRKFETESCSVMSFIDDMNAAYSAADLVLARAGATTIAEITALGIPSILVPSPYVAENHQFYNAQSLADQDAAVLLKDENIDEKLFTVVKGTIKNESALEQLRTKALALGRPEAAEIIAKSIIAYAEEKKGI